MNNYRKPNFLLAFLILFTLLSVTSSPLSLTNEVLGASDNSSNGGGNGKGNNGNGQANGGSDGDDGDDGGSDGDNDDGDDGGSDGDNDDGDDGGSDGDNDDGDGGGSDGDNDDGYNGGSDGDNDDGGSDDNIEFDTKIEGPNRNNTEPFVSQVNNQTVGDKYGGEVFYILIKSANNKTTFVPDKVTLSVGSTVVWLNYDKSDHRITVGSKSESEYSLLNSLILPNGMVDQEFQSPGTYFYSDLDNPRSNGVITILDSAEKEDAISIPVKD
jgi:plastocyanin